MKRAGVLPHRLAALGAAALGLSTALAAPPQTVYRCGPDGRSYSQTPCADGRPVSAEDSRSASQQKAAREAAERESQQVQKMAEERRQREAAAQSQVAAGFRTAPVAAGAASAPPPKAKAKTAKTAAADGPPGVMSPPMRVPVPTPAAK